jgi:hypothetical protein
MVLWTLAVVLGAVQWQHPAGMTTSETISEVRAKLDSQAWARALYAAHKNELDRWLAVPAEELARVFPRKRGNVYHNFSCPDDRNRLTFDPFNPDMFTCPQCQKTFPAETDPGVYERGDCYHGSMYDGWACLFYQMAGAVATDMALADRVEQIDKYTRRAVEILMIYADTIEHLPLDRPGEAASSRILTYHREGDNKVLFDLAQAYELLRDSMTAEQRARFEKVVLQRMLDDVILERIYTMDWNNVYQWHRTIVQTALALEREDLIDWSFGYGPFDPEREPEHRSLCRLVEKHFLPDGAYWELCSGYHLYPVHFFCEFAVLSRNLSKMDPVRFPPGKYDMTDSGAPSGTVLRNALHWFVSLAMPDRSMPTVGDSMAPRAGMDSYFPTAEVGYRFFDLRAVGDYENLRKGNRSWGALLYGAPEIVQHPSHDTSSYLSSGWVSLRNRWRDNDVWVGLNALQPGGGHQHADRLTLVTYAHGKLLALEKATPYNENGTRVLGTYAQSHNTVIVDRVTQKQGESLKSAEIPHVALFHAGPVARFAELRADNLYPQTSIYRRSVALIEDVIVDVFCVEGGATHDWMLHHAGGPPAFSLPMQDGVFEPREWLYNGTSRIRTARTDAQWTAQWTVDDVTSRLTMLDAPGTSVFGLETYPVDNAVITPDSPPCQTLCVRRENDVPFVAVWDAWKNEPNLQRVTRGTCDASLRIQTTSHTYFVLSGAGESRFEDGVELISDAPLSVVRDNDALAMVCGTRLELRRKDKALRVTVSAPATVSAEWNTEGWHADTHAPIQYDTYGGIDHPRTPPEVRVTLESDLE